MLKKLLSHHPDLGFLILGFLGLRLLNLTIIPIFGDEAIYLSWSQTIAEDFGQVFIPLSDGKQPLFMWLTALLTEIFARDPLFAPRLVSVASGLAAMVGVYVIIEKLVSKRAAFIAAMVYIVTPMLFFYDRLGVPDNMLAAFGVWALYLAIRLVERPMVKRAVYVGIAVGFGLLTKSPAIFYLLLIPSVLLLAPKFHDQPKRLYVRFGNYYLVIIGVAIAISFILRLSPLYYVIGERTNDFVLSPLHLVTNPLDPFVSRIGVVTEWLVGYLTPTIIGFGVIGLILGFKYKQWIVVVLSVWFLVPLLIEMALARGFTPRYFLFAIPPFVMLAGLGFYWLVLWIPTKYRRVASVLLALLFISPVYFIDLLITRPDAAPIPQKERTGYLEDWTAGHGIREVGQYLKEQPVDDQILVGTEGHFGTLPDGLIVYNRKSPNIHVEGMGQPASIDKIPDPLWQWLLQGQGYRAFLVVNKSRMHVSSAERVHLRLIAEYPKAEGPIGQDSLLFYEVLP